MPSAKNPLEMDYVYSAESTREYRNTHVTIQVNDDSAVIEIIPVQPLTSGELDAILSDIENDVLKKMRIKLLEECCVVLKQDGQTYTITLADEKPRVKGMIKS